MKQLMSVVAAALISGAWISGISAAGADEFISSGVPIHYFVKGHGEPVILVHGLYSSAAMNWQWPGTVNELAKHYQVIAFDNRGHGQSGKPADQSEYGVQMAEDIARLMDHLHIQKAHLVGYSLGGIIVMKFLTLHPERVSSAVLGGMGWLEANSPLDRFWASIPARPRKRAAVPLACLRSVSQLATSENDVKGIHVPVAVIVGDHDPCLKLYVQPLQRIRPDIPVTVVHNAGHITCIVKPEFQRAVDESLAAASNAH